MREMRYIISLFSGSNDFDAQWLLFKAYLNTVHSLADNDRAAKTNFFSNELMNFSLVLRNIVHHQPAKWHFGKHDVYPTGMELNFSQDSGVNVKGKLSLVIEKATLENEELQEALGSQSTKQLNVLQSSLDKIGGHIVVFSFIAEIQRYVEKYCKENNKYTEAYDAEPLGYNLIENV